MCLVKHFCSSINLFHSLLNKMYICVVCAYTRSCSAVQIRCRHRRRRTVWLHSDLKTNWIGLLKVSL